MIATMAIALQQSDPDNLTKVYDSEGNDCGQGDAKDYPLLFLQTFQKPFSSICVKECPRFDYNKIKYGDNAPATTTVVEAETTRLLQAEDKNPNDSSNPVYFDQFSAEFAGLSTTHDINFAEKEAFGYDKRWVNDYYTEEQFWAYQKDFKVECLANNDIPSCKFDQDKLVFYDSYPVFNTVCVPNTPKAALLFNKVSSQFNNGVIGDMAEASHMFIYVALISLAASLVFLVLVCCCTGLITWVMILGLALVFLSVGGVIIASYVYTGPLNDSVNAARVKYLSFLYSHKPFFIVLAVVFILIGLFIFYFMCKFRNHIGVAIPMIKYASKTTLKNILLIFLSVFVLVVQFCVLFLELYIILRLYTTGEEIVNKETGSPFI